MMTDQISPELQGALFFQHLSGGSRAEAERIIKRHHYTRCVPSGKSWWFEFGSALICFSIPANKNIGKFLLGTDCNCWELSRLWAPDGHEKNLLTRAIAISVDAFSAIETACDVLVSYADPNVSHSGGVYRAASWVFTGKSEETRYYLSPEGHSVARRKFHSGGSFSRKAEIEALGYREEKRPGKLRFARGLTRSARRLLAERFSSSSSGVVV